MAASAAEPELKMHRLIALLALICLSGVLLWSEAISSYTAEGVCPTEPAEIEACVSPTPLPTLMVAPIPDGIPAYSRSQWRHWVDADRDCQNTRVEVLIEESLIPVSFSDARECVVVGGHWIDPHTGIEVFEARLLDIDHMVPLANAHRSGGWQWNATDRQAYANDLSNPAHLIAVTASANRSKGDKGPEAWKPPNEGYWCQYATDWIGVKTIWVLSVTQEEWDALTDMLGRC